MDLRDRRILITGGGSGIGLALARLLAEANDVIVASRDDDKLRRLVAGVPRIHAVRLDVTSEESSRKAVTDAVERLGGLDILVNSAGILRGTRFDGDSGGRGMKEEIAVNLVGSLRMTRLAVAHLQRAGGAVVFLSSALALTAVPGLASYAATKAGVHSAARSLRAELSGRVKVFDVLPPFVDTPLTAGLGRGKLTPEAVAREILDGIRRDRFEIPIGRVRALVRLARFWPSAADRIIARELKTVA